MKIIVMGSGAFGSAIMSLLEENKAPAAYWKGGALPAKSIVFGVIPTQAISEVLKESKSVRDIIYVNCAKGIEQDTHQLPYQIVDKALSSPAYTTLIGPSFASEVKEKMPTLVNLGYDNIQAAHTVKKLLQTDYFRISLTTGVASLELAAAFKNIYAISCGIAKGLGFEINTRVKLMCLAMEEFNNLRKTLDYQIDERAIPGTLGDLILTCSSTESRNFTFGKFLAEYSPEDSLQKVKQTVEGYYTVKSVPYFEAKAGIKLPLAHFVYDIIYNSQTTQLKAQFMEFVKKT
ncbi:MAG: hypothetical protein KA035_01250 [Candidatus Levybacteria bacterium]|nr:hypothetical protein [Candidatus Levybacteria bacterium]